MLFVDDDQADLRDKCFLITAWVPTTIVDGSPLLAVAGNSVLRAEVSPAWQGRRAGQEPHWNSQAKTIDKPLKCCSARISVGAIHSA